jgi:hypothetical protein
MLECSPTHPHQAVPIGEFELAFVVVVFWVDDEINGRDLRGEADDDIGWVVDSTQRELTAEQAFAADVPRLTEIFD